MDLAVQELGKVLRASGSRGSKRGGAAEVYRGQGGEFQQRRKIVPAARLTGGAEARHGGDERRGFSGPQQWNGRRRGGVGC